MNTLSSQVHNLSSQVNILASQASALPSQTSTMSPQAKQFHRWLSGFPAASRDRLTEINIAATSARHIILTLTYSLIDPNIRSLSRVITNFLLLRLKHERAGRTEMCERLEGQLKDLHTAIDTITGVERLGHNSHEVCRSVSKARKAT